MKRFYLILFVFFITNISQGQIVGPVMQASIGVGSTPTRIKLYIRPLAGNGSVNGQIATLNFNVAIPASTPAPVPTMSIANTPYTGAGFQINVAYTESGYIHYNIANLNPFTVTIAEGVETEVMELNFSGNGTPAQVALATLPDQGNDGFALFYCTGAATSDGANLYYTRPGTVVTNLFSYTPFPNFSNPPGTSTSTAILTTNILLPIKWLGFNAVKQNKDALITWSVSDEELNNYYDLQRSVNGTDFSSIAIINKSGTGSGIHNYSYTDPDIANLGSPVLYYRLRQVDIDGRFTYSEVRILRLIDNSGSIHIFPNPAKDGFYVNIPYAGVAKNIYQLKLFTVTGQLVKSYDVSALQATNYYYDISKLAIASGNYYLQILLDDELLKTEKLIINR